MKNFIKSTLLYRKYRSFYIDKDKEKNTIYYMDRLTFYWMLITILMSMCLSLEIALGEFGDFLGYLIILPIIFLLMLEWHNKLNPKTEDEYKFNELQHLIFLHHMKKTGWVSGKFLTPQQEIQYDILKHKTNKTYRIVEFKRAFVLYVTGFLMLLSCTLFYSIIKILQINI